MAARLEGTYSASPLAAAGRVYFFNEDGQATVIEAARAFKVAAENHLETASWRRRRLPRIR